jgi:hypothetical protein
MGHNHETNVVDRFGFALPGASVMGTSGAHNPTLGLAGRDGQPSLLVFTHCPLKAVRRVAYLPVVRPALKSRTRWGAKEHWVPNDQSASIKRFRLRLFGQKQPLASKLLVLFLN